MSIAAPSSDQIEIALFGPGYGECAAVHLGKSSWIIVDSCIDPSNDRPAVLDYFRNIGVNLDNDIRLIVVSHWHDDHVRGISQIVEACPNAPICCSPTLTRAEFIRAILDYKQFVFRSSSTGLSEIEKIFQIAMGRKRFIWAGANKPVLNLKPDYDSPSCTVTTLSPSDREYDLFLLGIADLIPRKLEPKRRAPYLTPNHASVVLWIEAGPLSILLGSDLEEKGDTSTGWSVIVSSPGRPPGKARIFKVPHHGSKTGHNMDVWTEMIHEDRIAILSPYHLADKILPKDSDMRRICKLAPESYITSKGLAVKSKVLRPPGVQKMINATVKTLRQAYSALGWIRLRNGGATDPFNWNVSLSPQASKLANLITS